MKKLDQKLDQKNQEMMIYIMIVDIMNEYFLETKFYRLRKLIFKFSI